MLNTKIVVGGRVNPLDSGYPVDTSLLQIYTYERIWVHIWVAFCLMGMSL